MWKIIDRLYLGNSFDAGDLGTLTESGVTHVVNCTGGVACSFPAMIEYLQLAINAYDFPAQIDELCTFIDDGRAAGTVLVHCVEARQRGPAAVIAYLCHAGRPLDEAVALVRSATAARPTPFSPPPEGLLRVIRQRYSV